MEKEAGQKAAARGREAGEGRRGLASRAGNRGITIAANGVDATLAGHDDAEAKQHWSVPGVVSNGGKTIVVDFSPKGGPKDIKGVWNDKNGIDWADGNTWTKVEAKKE